MFTLQMVSGILPRPGTWGTLEGYGGDEKRIWLHKVDAALVLKGWRSADQSPVFTGCMRYLSCLIHYP